MSGKPFGTGLLEGVKGGGLESAISLRAFLFPTNGDMGAGKILPEFGTGV